MWENARNWMLTPLCGLLPNGFSFLELGFLEWKSNLVQIEPFKNHFKGFEKKCLKKGFMPNLKICNMSYDQLNGWESYY
jgi:hypothetical protein